MQRSGELMKWKAQSVGVRHKNGLPSMTSGSGWSQSHRLLGVPATPRVRDCIDVCYLMARKRQPQTVLKDIPISLFCNTSQSVTRGPMRKTLPTPSTSTCVYSFEFDRAISSRSYMRFLGVAFKHDPGHFHCVRVATLGGERLQHPDCNCGASAALREP